MWASTSHYSRRGKKAHLWQKGSVGLEQHPSGYMKDEGWLHSMTNILLDNKKWFWICRSSSYCMCCTLNCTFLTLWCIYPGDFCLWTVWKICGSTSCIKISKVPIALPSEGIQKFMDGFVPFTHSEPLLFFSHAYIPPSILTLLALSFLSQLGMEGCRFPFSQMLILFWHLFPWITFMRVKFLQSFPDKIQDWESGHLFLCLLGHHSDSISLSVE